MLLWLPCSTFAAHITPRLLWCAGICWCMKSWHHCRMAVSLVVSIAGITGLTLLLLLTPLLLPLLLLCYTSVTFCDSAG
jgi:hypothetical protein